MSGTRAVEPAPAARMDQGRAAAHLRATTWALPVAAVAALTVAAVVLRVLVARQSLFADELATWWVVTTHHFGGMISTVHSDAEITPPLYFVASWMTTLPGDTAMALRAPSLIAGTLTVPIIYLLGLRTVGRAGALVATAITALSPFAIYYSTEARGYAVMMALVALSTLAMLLAIDRRRVGWWVLYGAASCAAVYTHYTSVFALGGQLLWLLWAHPHARRAAILTNVGAVVLFAPWTTGVINDLGSPTTKILGVLSPLDLHNVRFTALHFLLGYPDPAVGIRAVPGTAALVLIAVAVVAGLVALAARLARNPPAAWSIRRDDRVVLTVVVALSVPVGAAIVSLAGTSVWSTRDLAAAWPATALVVGAVITAAGPRLRYATGVLAVVGLCVAAASTLGDAHRRPEYQDPGRYIDAHAGPGTPVVDLSASFSPGPLSPLDPTLHRPHEIFRGGAPAERDHPFGFFDSIVPRARAFAQAVAAAHGGPVYVVTPVHLGQRPGAPLVGFPASYRLASTLAYPGMFDTEVQRYVPRG